MATKGKQAAGGNAKGGAKGGNAPGNKNAPKAGASKGGKKGGEGGKGAAPLSGLAAALLRPRALRGRSALFVLRVLGRHGSACLSAPAGSHPRSSP